MGDNLVLPARQRIQSARASLINGLPATGLGLDKVKSHLLDDVVPGFNKPSKSAMFYGFVTGGVTPASAFADNLVTEYDQNVQVHLPNETLCTDVEDRALQMVAELMDPVEIGRKNSPWQHRTFTTGATASNVLGLALGREYVIRQAAKKANVAVSVANDGIVKAMRKANIDDIQILTSGAHSSLKKAASIVGLGRQCFKDVSTANDHLLMDLDKLEQYLRQENTASIIAISCAEVNTGLFATNAQLMKSIAELAKTYGAWIHVDAAFGLTAALLPDEEDFAFVKEGIAGLASADSITGDGHKMLNVPYDCGIFLSKHLPLAVEVFQNPNAAYLNTASTETTASTDRSIPSPLNIGLENSRRFRALPVYASLAAYGRAGYTDMILRQVHLARTIARYIHDSADYELLPPYDKSAPFETKLRSIYMVVLFRAKDDGLNAKLTSKVNGSRQLYVSGTQWAGKPAARFAVANWLVDAEKDFSVVREVLERVASQRKA